MRSTLLALSATASLAAPALALADGSPVAGNMTLATDYRFRGLSQTFKQPALQGGFDYSHPSGFYLGNWDSNISDTMYAGAPLEMDFYGGYRGTVGDFGYDAGLYYYYYPGSKATLTNNGQTCTDCKIDNLEVYIGGSWKWVSLKYWYATTDFFGVPDTKGSNYIDLSATYDLGRGWGINGHFGHQKVKNLTDADYSDWKLGVTKLVGGWTLGAAYIDTNAKKSAYTLTSANGESKFIGDSTVVLSVGKTF